MEKKSVLLFEQHKEDILKSASAFFGTTPDQLQKLGAFESVVFTFERNGREYILKLTHDLHRTKNQILGELDWMDYLYDNGMRVPHSMQSVREQLVEPIPADGTQFFAYAFEKSPGAHLTEADWNDDLFAKWGKVTGRMHALTKNYRPSNPAITRPNWFDDGYFKWIYVHPANSADPEVLAMCHKYIDTYRNLPPDKDAFGLIHTDLHLWNFHVHDGEIIAFDFDDSRYDWFAHDLAIPLIYSLQDIKFGFKNREFIINFFRRFMEGYYSENEIDRFWLSQIPVFLKTREIDLYFIIKEEGIEDSNDWCRRFMKNRKEKIANDEPVIDLDFASLV